MWTRKRADVPVECDVRIGERRWRVEARGVEDESAGYHPHHTVWSWSAGRRPHRRRALGGLEPGQRHQRPARALRARDLGGRASPSSPARSSFEGLEAIAFDDGSRLEFSGECERRKEENRLLVRYTYRQPFGSFSGTLPGGLELEHGLGVMEHHDAHW